MKPPSVVSLVVEQHAQALAILWLQRDRAVGEPHYNLVDLARLDDRLQAQADGMQVAADLGWKIGAAELQKWAEPGEVFAAAVLAWGSGIAKRTQLVMQYGTSSYDNSRALVSS